VGSGDDEQMAGRIVSLLSEPERAAAMGACGREIVEQKFSNTAQLENIENLYARLLHRDGRVSLSHREPRREGAQELPDG
jgi:glycosyltransferase involved in cell wall biosynthesis